MMKRIIFTIVFTIAVNAILAQTYNMKIKQGTGSTYSATSTVDEITFDNTSNFTCGNTVLYGGETYPTVQIGDQCWFQKDLNIGTRIATNTDPVNNSTIEKYCYSNLDASCTTYGGLYQWNEAMNYSTTEGAQGICPVGWHIPTLDNFSTLNDFVVGNGNSLKSLGQGNVGGVGTNISGFSALLAGYRVSDGSFDAVDFWTFFWSSTEGSGAVYFSSLVADNAFLSIEIFPKSAKVGGSVRCIKD
jgi:uncharacterized protein (TIGR02145 family)